MPATKIKSTWSSGNLVFRENVAANGGSVIFGHTNGGIDVRFYGTTSSNYVLWDESANAMSFVGATLALASDLTLTGTTAANYAQFDSSANLLKFVNVDIQMGNGEDIKTTTAASNSFNIQAYGTAYANVIKILNSTGNAAIKLGFFAAAGSAQATGVAQLAASTTYDPTIITRVNSVLTALKNYGLMAAT